MSYPIGYKIKRESDGRWCEWNGFEFLPVPWTPETGYSPTPKQQSPDASEHVLGPLLPSATVLTQDAIDAFLRAADIPAAPEDSGPALPERDVITVAEAIEKLLGQLDPAPARQGLHETPLRAAKAWMHWTRGYTVDPAAILKTFEDGASGCDQMVVVRNIPFYSHCEHHLAPIFGSATVGYLPNGRIVGLSKLNRLVDVFARRLQVQERLTNQIADALAEHLQPLGVGVLVTARHFCMESRGVEHQGCETVTSALLGAFRDDPTVRAEFLALAREARS